MRVTQIGAAASERGPAGRAAGAARLRSEQRRAVTNASTACWLGSNVSDHDSYPAASFEASVSRRGKSGSGVDRLPG